MSKINNTFIDTAEDYIAITMYNLSEYSNKSIEHQEVCGIVIEMK